MKLLQVVVAFIIGIVVASATLSRVHRRSEPETSAASRVPAGPELKRQNDSLRIEVEGLRQQLATSRSILPEPAIVTALPAAPSKADEADAKARNIYEVWVSVGTK